ncbi:AAA family ATPase [Streptomyces acidiscabies]|uniref:AAA family ATPase n=1 Tax=Streptomyces acidiscabies TaxID=42234 RepID=UPI0030CE2339
MRPGAFVGRRSELRMLRQAAGRHRLVTLTGPGGCGKTRLLAEALRGSLARADQNVWWVDLAPAADGPAVTELIAAAVASKPAADRLVSAIGDQHAVLVLDTCERALDPCARLVAELIDRCPGYGSWPPAGRHWPCPARRSSRSRPSPSPRQGTASASGSWGGPTPSGCSSTGPAPPHPTSS